MFLGSHTKSGYNAGTKLLDPLPAMALTDIKIKNAKAKAQRYRLSDANGLAVEVTPAGGKYWRYRYRLNGKENLFAGGEWSGSPVGEKPEEAQARRADGRLTLAEARIGRQQWRADVKAGLHPRVAAQARELIGEHSRAQTFDAVAAEFIEKRGKEWSQGHRDNLKRFLERDISPGVGSLPIRSIQTSQLLTLLRRVEERDAISVAALGRGYLGQIFRYAIQVSKADYDPTAGLRGALERRYSKHHEPLSQADIVPFFAALTQAGGNRETKIAVQLMAYTFARTIELRCAPWTEFDLEKADWRLPKERMKMRRPHIVPLARQAVELLEELRELTGRRQFLFPNTRRPQTFMGATTINRVIERMGYLDRFTAQGFRATASTMLHEAGFSSELIERQLAHMEKNKSKASYDHSARLPERRLMMQSWADMLDEMRTPSSKVVPIGRRRA
jgi:integrase